MATVQPYLHEPLPSARSIRIISLAPSTKPDAEIRCTISTRDFDSVRGKNVYEALSYVWGSPTGTVPILCNDKELLVTSNCHDALHRLRRRFLPRVLWIDSICIDQKTDERSTKERNSQVQMMGDIFREARSVIVWLGVGDESTPWAFRQLGAVGWVACNLKRAFGFNGNEPKTIAKRLNYCLYGDGRLYSNPPEMVLKRSKAIQKVVENPWFFRVWTMQESGLASNCFVHCGKMRLRWEIFYAAISAFTFEFRNDKAYTIMDLRYDVKMLLRNQALGSRHCIRWAGAIGHLDSSLPQDKVYGLYPILRAMGLDLEAVDYELDISTIYGDVAKAFIKIEPHSLDILRLSIRPFGYDELPTWTPNWTTGHPHLEESWGVDFTGYRPLTLRWNSFCASKNSIAAIPLPYPPNELQVRGIIIGKVSRIIVSSSAAEPSDPARMKARISAFTQACRRFVLELDSLNFGGRYKEISATNDALAYIMFFTWLPTLDEQLWKSGLIGWLSILRYPNCGDLPLRDLEKAVGLEDHNPLGEQERLEAINRLLDPDRFRALSKKESAYTASLLSNLAWFHQLISHLANWAFLFLDTGYIGRAYFNSRENDRVALLAGSKVPFLLREVEGVQDRYQVVAPAYIYGVMHGELWPDDNETGVKDMILV